MLIFLKFTFIKNISRTLLDSIIKRLGSRFRFCPFRGVGSVVIHTVTLFIVSPIVCVGFECCLCIEFMALL